MDQTFLFSHSSFYLRSVQPVLDCTVYEYDNDHRASQAAQIKYDASTAPKYITVLTHLGTCDKFGRLVSLLLTIDGYGAHISELKATADVSEYELCDDITAFLTKYRGHTCRVGLLFCKEAQQSAEDLSLTYAGANDIVLIFPREGAKGRFLWTAQRILEAGSPYFRTMFASGFAESKQQIGGISEMSARLEKSMLNLARDAKTADVQVLPHSASDDSDDDDVREDGDQALKKLDSRTAGTDFRARYMIIHNGQYRTWHAVIHWLRTGQVTFAGLQSAKAHSTLPQAFPAASPKSVYKLCHELGVDGLRQLALAEYGRQVAVDNVLAELFSGRCYMYDELNNAAIAVLKANWTAVKANGGMQIIRKQLCADSVDLKETADIALSILETCKEL